jgi:Ser/Thr protein kinase RdoA (MazF antagonist)
VESPLQCVDSTVAPSALLSAIRQVYRVGDFATCELIQRNLDATYLVSDNSTRLIARLFNARWWSRAEIEAEIKVLRHLKATRVRAAFPVQRQDGGWASTIQAPEGERQLVVYEYLDGDALVPSRDARGYGEVVGRMHAALADCVLEHNRRELTCRRLANDAFDPIIAQLNAGSEHRDYLDALRARVLARAEDIGLSSFREGLCHGDLNFSNAVRLSDGQIGLYDFESCGPGMLAYDLAVFRWAQQLVGAPDQAWHDFIDGYRTCYELPDRELEAMGLLVLLRQLHMLEHDARRTQIESLGGRWRRARWTPQFDGLRRLDAQLFGTDSLQSW